jgi:hypothetical protein
MLSGVMQMRKKKIITTLQADTSQEKSPMTPPSLLQQYFDEAKELGYFLSPDDAMRRLVDDVEESKISLLFGKPAKVIWLKGTNPKEPKSLSILRKLRKLHHLAVDLYYKARMPGPGRPRTISDDRCGKLLDKKLIEKKTYLQIAKELGEPVRTPEEKRTAKQKIRQQVRIAINRII